MELRNICSKNYRHCFLNMTKLAMSTAQYKRSTSRKIH